MINLLTGINVSYHNEEGIHPFFNNQGIIDVNKDYLPRFNVGKVVV